MYQLSVGAVRHLADRSECDNPTDVSALGGVGTLILPTVQDCVNVSRFSAVRCGTLESSGGRCFWRRGQYDPC